MAGQIFQVFVGEEVEHHASPLSQTPAELTTHETADLINVSERYLVSLLDSNAIPSRKVGVCGRVLFDDLMAYKKSEDAAQRIAELSELTQQAQDLSLGY
jgi:excisionase family DNA binding protein